MNDEERPPHEPPVSREVLLSVLDTVRQGLRLATEQVPRDHELTDDLSKGLEQLARLIGYLDKEAADPVDEERLRRTEATASAAAYALWVMKIYLTDKRYHCALMQMVLFLSFATGSEGDELEDMFKVIRRKSGKSLKDIFGGTGNINFLRRN